MKWYQLVGFTVLVTVATYLIRVPLPGGGYFNFGDIAVIFAGLWGGKKLGLIAGGLGSAIADLIGFPVFAPITLIAKGGEGFLSGLAHGKKTIWRYSFPIVGSLFMVVVYFLGTAILPMCGIANAIAEVPANLVQAVLGNIGARLLFMAVEKYGL
ncbi:MAG TPA: ECF transporter S component [Candidatus Cloacimonadota bacterium]|nr:ECF transporter S component [Candidatus Cloacimonadota bacterium]HPS39559.1 ECF transporter S component [Candidatus Cloacimonadota bacterium]